MIVGGTWHHFRILSGKEIAMIGKLVTSLLVSWAGIGGIWGLSEAGAGEALEPIRVVASQVCECSPAVTSLDRGATAGWRHVPPPAVRVAKVPTMAPAVGPWLPTNGQNLAPPAVRMVEPTPMGAGVVHTFKPVMALPPTATGYQLGHGLLGQPKVYVPGQPIRNFVRYLSP
jgi:hypothetical protein